MYKNCNEGVCCEDNSVVPERPDSLFLVIQDNYDLALKVRELAQHINGQLYASPYEDEKMPQVNCALDNLIETRRLLRSALGTINDIRMRMEG